MRHKAESESTPRSPVTMQMLHWVVVSPIIFTHLHRGIFIFYNCPHVVLALFPRGSAQSSFKHGCSSCLIVANPNSPELFRHQQDSSSLNRVTFLFNHEFAISEATLGEAEDSVLHLICTAASRRLRSLQLVFHDSGNIFSRVWDVREGWWHMSKGSWDMSDDDATDAHLFLRTGELVSFFVRCQGLEEVGVQRVGLSVCATSFGIMLGDGSGGARLNVKRGGVVRRHADAGAVTVMCACLRSGRTRLWYQSCLTWGPK